MAESTNSKTFDNWANGVATQNNGRVPRDLYLDEMGRQWETTGRPMGTRDEYVKSLRGRWQTMDPDNRGLTPAEVSKMTGNVDSSTSALPKSGSGVQPGNMGPGNTKK
ncbi:MAG: hypothetical protein ABJB78_04950 [Betaproteobacteria bacterium]